VDEHKVAYVQSLLEWASADARQVYLRVTAALAIATLFLTQLPFETMQRLSTSWTVALFVGLGLLGFAAFLYFLYVSATHHARRKIAKYILTPNLVTNETPDNELTGVWKSSRYWAFWGGNFIFAVGIVVLGAVLWEMLSLPPAPSSN
jgi:hypothetical protein